MTDLRSRRSVLRSVPNALRAGQGAADRRLPAPLPDRGRHRHDRSRQERAGRPPQRRTASRRRARGRLGRDGEAGTTRPAAARLPVPGGAGRERRDPARSARRGVPRQPGRRRAARGGQRLRDRPPPGRQDRQRRGGPGRAAGPRAGGLDRHRAPDRVDGGPSYPADLVGRRRDQGRPLPGRHRRGGAVLLTGQRHAVRRPPRRAPRPGGRSQALRRRAAGVQPSRRREPRQAEAARRRTSPRSRRGWVSSPATSEPARLRSGELGAGKHGGDEEHARGDQARAEHAVDLRRGPCRATRRAATRSGRSPPPSPARCSSLIALIRCSS